MMIHIHCIHEHACISSLCVVDWCSVVYLVDRAERFIGKGTLLHKLRTALLNK